MSPSSIPLSDLEAGNAAKFTQFGDSYAGTITAMEERQQTDTAGNLLFFPDETPRMLWVITIQPDGGDAVQLWAKGGRYKAAEGTGESMLAAIGLAVRAAEADGVDVGGQLAVAYTGNGEKTSKGGTPKLYTAEYRPPKPAGIPATNLFKEG
jgi:hypothetical protein